MNRALILHGFILIALALIGAFFIPAMALPRLGLSAHTVGLLSGVLLLSIGGVWPVFMLGRAQRRILAVSWVASGYLNWLGCLIGAVFGAGRVTPISAAGATGPAWAEGLAGGLLTLSAAAALLAVCLSLFGLRGKRGPASW